MALALLPSFESSRTLQPSYPSPTLFWPLVAMEQANKVRPSLPSISSLIEAVTERSEKANAPSPTFDSVRRISGESYGHGASPEKAKILGSPRSLPPPTPEFPLTSSFDLPRPSHSNMSPGQLSNGKTYHQSTNPELYAQRPSSYSLAGEPSAMYPSPSTSNRWPSPSVQRLSGVLNHEPISRPLTTPSKEVQVEIAANSGLSQQRPLPTDFPGPLPGIHLPPIDPAMAPTWQHHHYYPPTNPSSYPQTQERYICPTCNKPFSRPSSLKIHTYSHTGEKPYKCKHEGCGKYFSVRSNMKRHEKGCHGGETANGRASSPRTIS